MTGLEFPPYRVWVPIDGVVLRTASGQTAAITETTFRLASVAGIVPPPNTAAAQLRGVAQMTGGSGTARIVVKHKPSGAPIVSAVSSTSDEASDSALVDVQDGLVTFETLITGTPTYTYTITLTGFLRAP